MKKQFLAFAILLAGSVSAFAQSGVTVKQSGNITPNQVPWWITSGVIGGGVTAADSPISSFGATGPICSNSARQSSGGWQQLCIQANQSAAGTISIQNYGTQPPEPLNFNIDGVVYAFPFTVGGIVGPSSSVIGDLACWNNTAGSLLSDCGVPLPTLVANNFAGSDIAAKINAAEAALPATGGSIVVQSGVYSSINTTITLSKTTQLNLNGSILTFVAGRDGLLCSTTALFSTVFNGRLRGTDVALGTNDGMSIQCPFFTGTQLFVQNFGRDQVAILSAPTVGGANADNWILNQVLAQNSFRDGFHVEGSDSNNGICNGCESQNFARYGFFDSSLVGNIYNSPNADNLSAGGAGTVAFQLTGSSITVNGAFCEKGTNTANVAGNSNTFYNSSIAPCTLVNGGGGAAFSNQIVDYTAGGYPSFMNNIVVGAIGDTNAFGWRINPGIAGRLELRNVLLGTVLQSYDTSTTTWTTVGTTAFPGVITNTGMPTSCAGQVAGTLRNNSGVVNVCP